VKLIDTILLDSLSGKAKDSTRKRAHHNLHPELGDPVQRLCIAMEPDTYVRPHRHSDPETWEILMILRGSAVILFFDDTGKVFDRAVLTADGKTRAVEFPANTWHAPVSLETNTVVFEVKQGPYVPLAETNLAAWAPPEGAPATVQFLEWYRRASTGDIPPEY